MPTEKNAPNRKRYYENEDFRYDSLTGTLYHNKDKRGPIKKGVKVNQRVTHKGYLVSKHKQVMRQQHHIVWYVVYGYWPRELDHINGIKKDNRLINLREVKPGENQKNRPIQKNNTSGCSGVLFHKRDKKWATYIRVKGIMVYLGYYDSYNVAVKVRKKAEKKFGFHPNHNLTKEERGKYV
jgi:hypothetical protein